MRQGKIRRKSKPACKSPDEMTESLILAQNERWRRVLSMQVARQGASAPESGGRVSNTWIICPPVGDSPWKHGVIPDATGSAKAHPRKGATAAPGDESAVH